MNIRYYSLVLITNNLEKLRKFYSVVLQQEIEHDFGACIIFRCGLSIWKISPSHPVAKVTGNTNQGNKSMELCFETEEFDEVYKNLLNEKLSVLHDLIEEPWGQRTIRFFDPDNNLIEVGESISAFVKRMYYDGMSISGIVKKTSVAEELVKDIISKC